MYMGLTLVLQYMKKIKLLEVGIQGFELCPFAQKKDRQKLEIDKIMSNVLMSNKWMFHDLPCPL